MISIFQLARRLQLGEGMLPRIEAVNLDIAVGVSHDDAVVLRPVDVGLRGVATQALCIAERCDGVVGCRRCTSLGRATTVCHDDIVGRLRSCCREGEGLLDVRLRAAVALAERLRDSIQVYFVLAPEQGSEEYREFSTLK